MRTDNMQRVGHVCSERARCLQGDAPREGVYRGEAGSKLTAIKAQVGSLSAWLAVGTNPTASAWAFLLSSNWQRHALRLAAPRVTSPVRSSGLRRLVRQYSEATA